MLAISSFRLMSPLSEATTLPFRDARKERFVCSFMFTMIRALIDAAIAWILTWSSGNLEKVSSRRKFFLVFGSVIGS